MPQGRAEVNILNQFAIKPKSTTKQTIERHRERRQTEHRVTRPGELIETRGWNEDIAGDTFVDSSVVYWIPTYSLDRTPRLAIRLPRGGQPISRLVLSVFSTGKTRRTGRYTKE